MKLGLKIIVPITILLTVQLGAFVYILNDLRVQEKSTRREIDTAKKINSLNAELISLQQQTDISVLSYRFKQNEVFLNTISQVQLQKAHILDQMSPLIYSSYGRDLVSKYISSRSGAEQVRNNLILAIQNKDSAGIEQSFTNWTQQTDIIKATLADFEAFNINTIELSLNSESIIRNRVTASIYEVAGLVILMVLFMYFYFRLTIISPILSLKKAVKAIAEGNFTTTVTVSSTDEIGNLASSFKLMTKRLEKSYSELEEKVREKTVELRANIQQLEIDEKNLLEQSNLLETVLENLPVGVFMVSAPEGTPLMINRVGIELLGKGMDMDARKNNYSEIYQVFKEDGSVYPSVELPLSMVLTQGGVVSKDNMRIKRSNGEVLSLRATATVVPDSTGKTKSAVVVFEDITKEKLIDKAKTEFVSLASHQLRTPLTAINWYTEMLLNKDLGHMSPVQRKYLFEIQLGNRRMVSLVGNLLNVSRIDLGTFLIKPLLIDIAQVAKEVIHDLEPLQREQHIMVQEKYDPALPQLLLDPQLLQIIFQNIISNALKYTPKKGVIQVEILLHEQQVMVRISDTGYGIPKGEQDKIFTKLYRATNAQEKETDGTGLGLYIVKAAVEQSGGKIWFLSTENKGTTFFISFPMKPE